MTPMPPSYPLNVERIYVTFIQGLVGIPEAEGWAMIHVGTGMYSDTVRASDAFPPFDDLVTFLMRIARNELPAGFEQDEEGEVKQWLATPLPNSEFFRFSLMQDDWLAGWRPLTILLDGVFTRRQFVREFYRKLANFLASEHRPDLWRFAPVVQQEGLDRLEEAMEQWDLD